jgi:hypothetical protein
MKIIIIVALRTNQLSQCNREKQVTAAIIQGVIIIRTKNFDRAYNVY